MTFQPIHAHELEQVTGGFDLAQAVDTGNMWGGRLAQPGGYAGTVVGGVAGGVTGFGGGAIPGAFAGGAIGAGIGGTAGFVGGFAANTYQQLRAPR